MPWASYSFGASAMSKIEMMLGAVVFLQLEKRLCKFGANQRQAWVIGKGRAIVLGGPGQVAARLEDQAFNEELPVSAKFARQGIAFEEACRQFVLAGFCTAVISSFTRVASVEASYSAICWGDGVDGCLGQSGCATSRAEQESAQKTVRILVCRFPDLMDMRQSPERYWPLKAPLMVQKAALDHR